jgi:hypothetical protein
MCPSLASVGACFLGIAIGGLTMTSAAVLLPCLTSLGETAPAAVVVNNSNFRERRSNGKICYKIDKKITI